MQNKGTASHPTMHKVVPNRSTLGDSLRLKALLQEFLPVISTMGATVTKIYKGIKGT